MTPHDRRRRRNAGVALALTSAACFGVMPVLTKVVYDDGADPVGVLAVRFALAAVVLLALSRARGEALPRGRPLAALAALGAVGYVGLSLCYFFALDRIPAVLSTLLLYFFPALVVVLGALLFGDQPRAAALGCVASPRSAPSSRSGRSGVDRSSACCWRWARRCSTRSTCCSAAACTASGRWPAPRPC